MKTFFAKLGRWIKVRYILVVGCMHMLKQIVMDCDYHRRAWNISASQAVDDVCTEKYYKECCEKMLSWAEQKFGMTAQEMDEAWEWS